MEQEHQQPEKLDLSQMWDGLYYLTFFVFAIIVLIPNLPKSLTLNYYYPLAMVIYGTVGVFTGIGVYRLVRNASHIIKWAIIVLIYVAIIYQLITHVESFMVPY